jgi:hypothetical protein
MKYSNHVSKSLSRLSITIYNMPGYRLITLPVSDRHVSSSGNNKSQSAHRYMKIKNLPALDLLENRLATISPEWIA